MPKLLRSRFGSLRRVSADPPLETAACIVGVDVLLRNVAADDWACRCCPVRPESQGSAAIKKPRAGGTSDTGRC